jgi:hypothetical protein
LRRDYPQAEPPGPITCAVYVLVAALFLAAVLYVLAHTGVI